jgi:hypothetical protein
MRTGVDRGKSIPWNAKDLEEIHQEMKAGCFGYY